MEKDILMEETYSSSSTTSMATVLSDQDLLTEILKISSSAGGRSGLQNRIIFSSVCSSWRSVAVNNHPYKPVPWLMLSKLDSHQEMRSFFDLDENKIHEIKLSDDANSSWCGGSSEGWLVMNHKTSGTFLYNPITGDRINLPRYYSYVPKAAEWWWDGIPRFITKPSMYITKAIVVTSSSLISSSSFSPPSNQHPHHHHGIVAVVAIFADNQFIGFCRPGDKRWQFFALCGDMPCRFRLLACFEPDWECKITDEIIDDDDYTADYKYSIKYPFFADVILCRGALYAITHRTAIIGVFKFDTSTSRVIRKIQWLDMLPMKLQMRYSSWNYLVESCDGELLMVVRRRSRSSSANVSANDYENGYKSVRTWRFLVFKLDESSNPMKWVRIRSLGDQILFLGTNHSKSIRASDIPGARSGNCIYFTAEYNWCHLWARKNDWPNPGSSYPSDDTGVFYLEDGRFETIITNEDVGDDDLGTGIRSTFPSTIEYPPIFITPNPWSSASSSFTITHDNHSPAAATRDLYTLLSSSKCLRYAAISIFLAGTATIVLSRTGLDFLKSPPLPLPPMPESK